MSKGFTPIKFICSLTILLFMIYDSNSLCGKGCLRCREETNECLLCDYEQFYFFDLESQICKINFINSCELAFSKKNCVLCKENHHPIAEGICNMNNASEQIQNCSLYYSKKKCALCEEGYYLTSDSDSCKKVSENIDNCSVYTEDKCSVCIENYSLNSSFNCKKSNSNSSCLSKNIQFGCSNDDCSDGSYPSVNLNNLLNQSVDNKNENLLRSVLRLASLKRRNVLLNSDFLKYYLNNELSVNNSLKNINELNQDQFLLSSQTLNPFENNFEARKKNYLNLYPENQSIDFSVVQFLFPFCKTVDEKSLQCNECFAGFQLNEQNSCREILKIQVLENCLVFESFEKCSQCQEGFIKNDNGKCETNLSKVIPTLLTNNNPDLNVILENDLDYVLPIIDDGNNNPDSNLNRESNPIINESNNKDLGNEKESERNPESDQINLINIISDTNNILNQNDSSEQNLENLDEPQNQNDQVLNIDKITEEDTQPNENSQLEPLDTNINELNNEDAPPNENSQLEPLDTNTNQLNNEDAPPNENSQPDINPNQNDLVEENNNDSTNDSNQSDIIFSKGLENLVQQVSVIPEEDIELENTSFVKVDESDNVTNPVNFRTNRGYLFRRRYNSLNNKNQLFESDYAVIMRDEDVILIEEEKENNEQKIFEISKNCSLIGLIGDLEVPSCRACIRPQENILIPISSKESKIFHCQKRKNFVANCILYFQIQERCKGCDANHFLYERDSYQKCLPTLKGCLKNTVSEGIIKCTFCDKNHFLSGNICKTISAQIPNCINQINNQCTTCKEGYFNFKNICMIELAFHFFNCPLNDNNECDCGPNSTKVSSLDQCVPIESDNCLQYDSDNLCTKCKNGYYLGSSKNCIQGQIQFCKQYSLLSNEEEQKCSSCEDSYVLDNNKCRSSLSYFTSNCEDVNGEFCLQCAQDYFRVDLSSNPNPLTMCLTKDLQEIHPAIEFCIIFNSITKSCELCEDGLYIDENGRCSECDREGYVIDNFNTKCFKPTKLVDGCELYDEDFCVKCKETTLPYIADPVLFTLTTRTYQDKKKNIFTESPNFVINECDIELSDSCLTDFCETAINLQSGKTCCSKCKKGRSGIWSQEDQQFFTSDCSDSVEFCDLESSIQGIPIEYMKFLTCESCLNDRIIDLSLTEDVKQIECVEIPANQPELANCLVKVDTLCRICKPGFIILFSNSSENKVFCEKITNCKSSNTIDQCDECEENFSLNSAKNACLPSPIPNCKMVSEDLECSSCHDGMILKNNNCISLKENNLCTRFDSENCLECAQNDETESLILYKMNFTQVSSFTDFKKSICINSSSSPFLFSTRNCTKFLDSNFCFECKPGFFLQKVSKFEQKCVEVNSTIKNCMIYDSELNCSTCENGFYLEGDRCFPGEISNCSSYIDSINCSECDEGYEVISTDSKKLCYLSHSISNCEVTNLSQMDGLFSLNCEFCESSFKVQKDPNSSNLCFPLRNKLKCRRVNQTTTECEECDDYYFLNQDSECEKRKNLQINNCEVFHPNDDSCFQCENNYIMSNDGLVCDLREIPLLVGCKFQNPNIEECLICETGYFMNSNKMCQKVQNIIPNCQEYFDEFSCVKCLTGFFLKDELPSVECVEDNRLLAELFDVETTQIELKIEEPSVSADSRILQSDLISNVTLPQTNQILNNSKDKLSNLVTDSLSTVTDKTTETISKPENFIKDSIDNVSDKLTDQVIGENGNPIIKNIVKDQIKNSINDKTNSTTEEISDLKNRLSELNKDSEEKIKEQLKMVEIPFLNNSNPNSDSEKNESETEKQNTTSQKNEETKETTPSNNSENDQNILGIKCGLCQDGSSFSTVSNQCVKHSEIGCLIMIKDANSLNRCEVCQSGFFIDENKECIKNFVQSLNIFSFSLILGLIFVEVFII